MSDPQKEFRAKRKNKLRCSWHGSGVLRREFRQGSANPCAVTKHNKAGAGKKPFTIERRCTAGADQWPWYTDSVGWHVGYRYTTKRGATQALASIIKRQKSGNYWHRGWEYRLGPWAEEE